MASRAELNRLILLKLGVLDAGESPEAEDAADVDIHAQAKLEELHSDGLIAFDLDGEIPAPYLVPISYLVAAELLPDYGADGRAQAVLAGAERGIKALYRFAAKPYSGAVLPAEYF